jgi:carbamoyl-phosphate synthase large subunit
MPRRDDIHKILILGSGPIVIGQAAEFDYSGTQACKALRAAGYEVVLVNANPATIMTDPEVADRTYVEPLTPEFVEMVIRAERPDALLPTLGGQTALNLAKALHETGVLERHGVRLIGANYDAIHKGEDRQRFQQAMAKIGIKTPLGKMIARSTRPSPSSTRSATRRSSGRASRSAAPAAASPTTRPSSAGHRPPGPARLPRPHRAGRAVGAGLEGVRARGDARRERHRRDHLLDREPRPDGRPHGRQHHGRAGADALRQGVPAACATTRSRSSARSASTPAARTSSSPSTRTNGDVIVIEMNPRVSRSSALASKATGYPIAKIAALLAVGYHLDELPNDITKETKAAFEPSIDYVVTKIPRFAFEKFPGTPDALGTQMRSVGEVMAIGRTFKESLQKAIRSLELDVRHAFADADEARSRPPLRQPQAPRRGHRAAAARPQRGAAARADRHRPVVPGAAARDRRGRARDGGAGRPGRVELGDLARGQAARLLRRRHRALTGTAPADVRAWRAPRARRRSTRRSTPAPPSSRPTPRTTTPPTSGRTRCGPPTATRSSSSDRGRTASVRASSSTTPPSTPCGRCATPASRRS